MTNPQRQAVLTLLHAPRFADQAPAEIYATLLDAGVYHCSIRTMYRLLEQNGESANAAHNCVTYERWGRTAADLRHLALSATHARSRERFLALHEIVQGRCATEVAERTKRRPQTVMDWLHRYNNHGPAV